MDLVSRSAYVRHEAEGKGSVDRVMNVCTHHQQTSFQSLDVELEG